MRHRWTDRIGCDDIARGRGFAHADLIGVLVLVVVFGAIGMTVGAGLRQSARSGGDAFNLRQLIQAAQIFALSNDNEEYPVPDRIDVANTTIDLPPEDRLAKNTTGNIASFLVFNELVILDMLVSPNETNGDGVVALGAQYEFDSPSLALSPDDALWDPGLSGSPFDAGARHTPGLANQSYAHLVPFGRRLQTWRTSFDGTEFVWATRGPQYEGDTYPGGDWDLCATCPFGEASNTLLFNADPSEWVGHAAANDGSVRLLRSPTPPATSYQRTSDLATPDNLFVDEVDDVTSVGPPTDLGARGNLYLRPVYADASNTVKVWID